MKTAFKYKRKPNLKAGDIIGFRYDKSLESTVLEVKGNTVFHTSHLTNNVYEADINDIIKRREHDYTLDDIDEKDLDEAGYYDIPM